MSEFLIYSKYYTAEDAAFITSKLKEAGIAFRLDQDKNQLDDIIIGHNLDPMFVLKIRQENFAQVNDLIASEANADEATPYYLDEFSDAELVNIINTTNEWNAFDINYARQLLVSRGIMEPGQKIKYGSADDYKAQKLETQWLIPGYLMSCFTLVGIFIGLSLMNARKTLPNGHQVKLFDSNTRFHGKIMLCIGIITSLLFGLRIVTWLMTGNRFI